MTRVAPILLALAALLLPAGAHAEIAMLTNGRAIKVESWAIEDGEIVLALRGGGRVELSLDSVDRILDDEVVPEEEMAPIRESSIFPHRNWRFDETSPPLFGSRYDSLILEAARKFDVDAALVSAVIKAESDYQARIVSHKGARGLMQLMPSTARRFGVSDSFDPAANIYGGTHYLRLLLDQFDHDPELALASYNAGEGNVRKYDGVPPFRETVQYIRRIAGYFEQVPTSTPTSIAAR